MYLGKNVSVKKVPELLGKDNRFSKYAVSYQTVYNAIDNGLIPGVTRESLRTSSVTMYSDGQIGIPKWIREKYGFADGDVFGIEVLENQSILLVRQQV